MVGFMEKQLGSWVEEKNSQDNFLEMGRALDLRKKLGLPSYTYRVRDYDQVY